MCVCVRVCVGRGGGLGRRCSFSLRLELQAEADLVAAGVDVLAVQESGQSQLDSCGNTQVRIRTAVASSTRSSRYFGLTTGVQVGLTWLESLSVAQAHQAGVVHLGLNEDETGEKRRPTDFINRPFLVRTAQIAVVLIPSGHAETYREGRIRINLILGGDAKAGVAVSSGPRQVHSRLQLLVDLLVDGAAELGTVISEGKQDISTVKVAGS